MRALALSRASEMRALGTARSRVEARYFDGVSVLFPAQVRDWAEQLERTERIAVSTAHLAEMDGLEPPPTDRDNVEPAVRVLGDLPYFGGAPDVVERDRLVGRVNLPATTDRHDTELSRRTVRQPFSSSTAIPAES